MAGYYDSDGHYIMPEPERPKYVPGYDPNSMAINPEMTKRLEGINYDTRGLDAFRKGALRTGTSPWAALQIRKQGAEEMDMRERARRENAGQAAQARSMLGMRGGFTSGARERLARAGAASTVDASQNIARQGGINRLGIGIQDETNRIQQLSMLPGMETQKFNNDLAKENAWYTSKNTDINRMVQENQNVNAFNQNIFNQEKQAWGANQTANAQMDSGGSSFICTALRKHGLMSRKETALMTKFMLGAVATRADFFNWYFRHGKKAVEMAERQNFDWSAIKKQFVDDILKVLDRDAVEAQNLYAERACAFVQLFTGEKAPESVHKTGMLKSLVALPMLLTIPDVWAWMHSYYTPKIRKWAVS